MNNLFIETVITEDIPTVNGHIYRKGFLQKIKEKLQGEIEGRRCYVTIGHNFRPTEVLMEQGDIAGLIVGFKIDEGKGTLEIRPTETPSGSVLYSYVNNKLPLGVDFRVQGILEDESDNEGNRFVSMDEFSVEPVMAVILNEGNY